MIFSRGCTCLNTKGPIMTAQNDSPRTEDDRHPQPHISLPHRFKQPPLETLVSLGPLALLAGKWIGTGFNVMWRPDNTGDPAFKGLVKPKEFRRFLQLNETAETLTFDVIDSPIPNRGLGNQDDITIYGLNYLQKVRDNDTDIPNFPNPGEDLHIEPGLFLNVPASGGVENSNDANFPPPPPPSPIRTVPVTPARVVRLATIPHGVSVLMQGDRPDSNPVTTPLVIPPIYPIKAIEDVFISAGGTLAADYLSFPTGTGTGVGIQPANVPAQIADGTVTTTFHKVPETTLSEDIPYPNTFQTQSNGPFPTAWQAFADDPNVVLRNAIAGQTILGFIPIKLATLTRSAISQIPFLGFADPALEPSITAAAAGESNAFVHSATATFWIQWIKSEHHHHHHHDHHLNAQLNFLDPFPGVSKFLQLQYTQTVILNFNGVLWPHVSVATLRQQF